MLQATKGLNDTYCLKNVTYRASSPEVMMIEDRGKAGNMVENQVREERWISFT